MEFRATRDEAPKFEVREKEFALKNERVFPIHVYEIFDPNGFFNGQKDGVIGHIVIDSILWSDSSLAKGGTAMYPGCSLAETALKAHVMTQKQIPCHPLGLDPVFERLGGAKAGIDFESVSSGSRVSELVWRGFVQAAWNAGIVPKQYIFGLDVGTDERAAAIAVDQVQNRRVITGKPKELGGVEYDKQGFAGRGTVIVAEEMCKETHPHSFERGAFELRNAGTSVIIQGFGAVGMGVAMGLLEGGTPPRVIAVSDADPGRPPFCLYDHQGLDLAELLRLKRETGSIRLHSFGRNISAGDELEYACDVLFLCSSKQPSINLDNATKLDCYVLAQGANLGVMRDAERQLWKRGMASLPDYFTNYASAAATLVELSHDRGLIQPKDLVGSAWEYVQKTIRHNTRFLLDYVKDTGLSPPDAARSIVAYELLKAQTKRS